MRQFYTIFPKTIIDYGEFQVRHIYLTAFFLMSLLFMSGLSSQAQIRKDFTLRKPMFTINGDFTMIGNSNLTGNGSATGTFNNSNNDGKPMIYVDVDNDNSTLNSTTATLGFPVENSMNPASTEIIYAGLYWSGRAFSGFRNGEPSATNTFSVTKGGVTVNFDTKKVLLKGPGNANYTTVTAAEDDIFYPTGVSTTADNNYAMYVGYADVTDYVRTNGVGNYTVANMAIREGNAGGIGYYGGWALVVVYQNPKMISRNISLFDGYAFVNNSGADFSIPITGFKANAQGDVKAKAGYFAGEGDLASTGDFLSIRKSGTTGNNNSNFVKLTHGAGTEDNFFNSSIVGSFNRNPNNDNNYGVDLGIVQIPNTNNSIIKNNDVSTNIRYGTTSETFIITFLGFSIESVQSNGFVVHDGNGNSNNKVDSSGGNASTLPAQQLYANIINPTTNRVAYVIPVVNGLFNVSGIYNNGSTTGTFTVQLSTAQGVVGQPLNSGTPPSGWAFAGNTSEGGTPTGTQFTGRQTFAILDNGDVGGLMLGLNKIPSATSKTFVNVDNDLFADNSIPGYLGISLGSSALTGYNGTGGSLSGTDLEDCNTPNGCSVGKTYVIKSILSNTRLFYDFGTGAEELAVNDTIKNFDPAKMVLYGNDAHQGATPETYGFNYSMVDEAGSASSSVSYSITPVNSLPITLMTFNVTKNGNTTALSWATATEHNNAGFYVERSADGKNWEKIGHVLPQVPSGSSDSRSDYRFVDENPLDGVNYYRLKQVDFDGNIALSDIRVLSFDGKNEISLYPNPVRNEATVRGLTGTETIVVFDASGRQVIRQNVYERQALVSFSSLPQGIYHLRVIAKDGRTAKIISVVKSK